jgi:DNA-binding NarL/FixJ family response regulator
MYKIVLVRDESEFSYNLEDYLNLKYSILVQYETLEKAINTRKRNIYNPDFIIISLNNIKNDLNLLKKLKYVYCNPKIALILNNKEKELFKNAIMSGVNAIFDQNDRLFFNHLFYSALDQTYKEGSYINPVYCTLLFNFLYKSNSTKEIDLLSNRQNQIADKLIHGESYIGIADNLGISVNTVRKHIKLIYKKLNVQNKAGLFKYKDKQIECF